MHDRRAERSRKPTVLTRSSSPSSAEKTLASAAGSLAALTIRKTAARDRGASMLCASIGTLSQSFPVIPNAPLLAQRNASAKPASRPAFASDMHLYHVGSPQRQIANFEAGGAGSCAHPCPLPVRSRPITRGRLESSGDSNVVALLSWSRANL